LPGGKEANPPQGHVLSTPSSQKNDRLAPLREFSLRHRVLSLALVAVVTAVFASGLPDLRVDIRVEKTFPQASEHLVDYQSLRDTFGSDEDTAFCVVEFQQSVLERESLGRIHELTEALRDLELVDAGRLTSLSSATWVRLDGENELEMSPLYEPHRFETWDAEEMDRLLSEHPAFDQRLVSRDRRLAGFLIPMHPGDTSDETRARFVETLHAFFSPEGALAKDEVAYLDGFAVARESILTMIHEDSSRFVPLAFLALLIVLGLLFREVVTPVLALGVIGISVIWTLGGMAFFDVPINTMSTCIPVMVLVASVGDVVHLISSYRGALAAGDSKDVALRHAVKHVAIPCLLTSLTTAAGFLSLSLSQIEMLREMGMPVAFGVLAAYVVTLAALPPLLSWLPTPQTKTNGGVFASTGLALGRLVERHALPVIAVSLLLGATAIALLPALSRETRSLQGFDKDDPLSVSQTVLEERFGGSAGLELLISTEEPGRLLGPEVQASVLRFSNTLRNDRFRELGILAAHSLPDTLSDAFFTWNQRQDTYVNRLPDTAEGLAQLQFLMSFSDQDPTAGLVDDPDCPNAQRVRVRVANLYTSEFFKLVEEIEAEASRELPADVTLVVTGSTFMGRLVSQSLTDEMARSAAVALVLVGGLVLCFFRSPRMAALAVVCSGLPLLLVLGCMAATGTALTLSTSVVFALAFGISVDDTIHIVAGYTQRVARGESDAVARTLEETGGALLLSTVALVLGFSVLCVSHFPANRDFAWLLSLTLVFALVADLLFLPALLSLFDGDDRSDKIRVGLFALQVALGLSHADLKAIALPITGDGQTRLLKPVEGELNLSQSALGPDT
jgi:uncharacterized protein